MWSAAKFLRLLANPADGPDDVEYLDPPTGVDEVSTHYSHYNPQSWEGNGVSIIFCVNSPRWESVTLNGSALRLHGEDRGREIWTNYDFITPAPTAIDGDIRAYAGTGNLLIAVTGDGTYLDHTGDCFGVYD